ncbi:MAG: polyprenyl synthetase family protein [Pontiellaceae bacterium]|jgi:geranylgeranyl diphosphate synthase type II|nr:polyprenyl synthetase family protein [Pontiellaceae bacterium]
MNDLPTYLIQQMTSVNAALDRWLPSETVRPSKLHKAMRYSVFAGGKRLRPILCIASCEACGGTSEQALPAACALELLHTYTLIHDDLPAVDNDTLRRGRPTCHIAFDEATAILAGDALLTLSFEVLAEIPTIGSALAAKLARLSGSCGVIGGQMEDIDAEGKTPDADLVEYIHRNKTAALIQAACVMGGICAGADAQTLEKLAEYGGNTGLAFQIIDDLLDEAATVELLGKNIGSDKEKGKMTWQAVYGTDSSRKKADELTAAACAAADSLLSGIRLKELTRHMLCRTF